MKQFSLVLMTWLFCLQTFAQQPQTQTYHTIQKGETLFHLTQVYKVTAEAICNLNPGLSSTNFQAGKTIAIPPSEGQIEQKKRIETIKTDRPADATENFRDIHKVKKKETIFGICQLYGITEQELRTANPEMADPSYVLKKGTFLVIPFHTERIVQEVTPTDQELFDTHRPNLKFKQLKVALVLPFSSRERSRANTARLYYQGFMLAVDSLKHQGVNMDIHILDSGKNEEKMDSLMKTNSLLEANLLLCPQIEKSDAKVAAFSKKNRIITLVTRSAETANSPYLFVFNPGTEVAYNKVNDYVLKEFKDANIIILDMKDASNSSRRGQFTKELKDALTANGIAFKFLAIDSDEKTIKATLSNVKRNLIVPNSANLQILQKKLLPDWKKFIEDNAKYRISLLGYQEWLTLASELKSQFYALDTYIFSRWWLNPNNAATKSLARSYKHWYKEDMPTKMPSVPVIGFDSSFYMMKGLSEYGTAFAYNLDKMDVKPAQSFMDYERSNSWSGLLNQKIGFIHFNKKVVNVEF